MKCVYCEKEIDPVKEDYEPFGIDGDFIHKECKPNIEKAMDKIANMSDKEFAEWIRGM